MINSLTLLQPRDAHLNVTVPAELKLRIQEYANECGISVTDAVLIMLVFYFEQNLGLSQEHLGGKVG